MTGNKLLISQRIPLMHYALERMQVSYNGEHQQHPLLYPLVLANRERIGSQGLRLQAPKPGFAREFKGFMIFPRKNVNKEESHSSLLRTRT